MLRGKLAPFFEKPCFRVDTTVRDSGRKYPRTTITADNDTIIVNTLAYAKLYEGNPDKVWNSPVDRVLTMYDFLNFSNDYENAYIELNKTEK